MFAMALLALFSFESYSEDSQQILGQAINMYTGADASGSGLISGLISGFSWWGLIGGFLFGSIGFIAFVYGKKNAELKPLIIGILLLVYPYFFRSTVAIYIIGVTLTAALYLF